MRFTKEISDRRDSAMLTCHSYSSWAAEVTRLVVRERKIQIALRATVCFVRSAWLTRPIARALDRRARVAVADIATSGSKSEILRRCFVNMVGSIIVGSASCALLIMSSEQIACRLHAHADVKAAADTSLHQRNSRGPNAAPAKLHSTIVPPYQTATNGNESSVQCSA